MATKTLAKKVTAVALKKPGGAIVDMKAIQERLREQADAMGTRVAPAAGINIQVSQSKEFKFPDGTNCTEFQAVIVDFVSENTFYPEAFDRKAIKPPVCFAIGMDPRKMVPSLNSPDRQSDACADCPNYQYETAKTGKGKACKEGRKLVVIAPDGNADTPLWILNVSPTALKGFDTFVSTVARSFRLPPVGVVTTIGFNDAFDYPSLVFSNPQPNDHLGDHFGRQDEAKEILAREPDISGYEAAYGQQKKAPAKKVARR